MPQFRKNKVVYSLIFGALLIVLIVFPFSIDYDFEIEEWEKHKEKYFWDWIGQTTAGLASSEATADGRPFTWKSRDRMDREQMEFRYVDDGRIPFISVTDVDSETDMYGGINAVGFSLENTDAHNFPLNNPPENGWGRGMDDGQIHRLALATCRTVDDFAAILDSLNYMGRTYNYTWRTFDAFGGAALFETAAYEYYRYDAIDEPYGILVRSNYALAGPDPGPDNQRFGLHRHDRSEELFKDAAVRGILCPQYIIDVVCRDITTLLLDPYPLPFDGYDGDLPFGLVNNSASVGRWSTRAVLVAHGVRPYEDPLETVLWAMVGSPISGVATPLWVRAGSVPREYVGPPFSRLSNRMIQLRSWVYSVDARGVDTWKLTNPDNTGLWDFIYPLQDWVFRKTEQFVNSDEFSYEHLEAFQNEIAQQVADSLDNWRPQTITVNEVATPYFWNNQLHLRWGELTEGVFRNIDDVEYVIERSPYPFRNNEIGEEVAVVRGTSWVDEDPPAGRSFYRIKARTL